MSIYSSVFRILTRGEGLIKISEDLFLFITLFVKESDIKSELKIISGI